jgi:serpin B
MKKLLVPLLLSLLMIVSACARPSYGEELKSDLPRLTPDVSAADMAELVTGNTDFALALYQLLKEDGGNFFYSPYSISVALAMTYAGAEGETEAQMRQALRFSLGQEGLHQAMNVLDAAINSRGQEARGKDDQPFSLKVVNAIWGQQDFNFLPSFLDTLAENYGAGLRTLDFAADPDGARQTINDWVSKETEKRIQNLLPPGSIKEITRLVLTNAIYFNGGWARPFEESATGNAAFHLVDGRQVTVSMMRQSETLNYGAGQGWQAVELKYDGGELSMVIILPDAGAFNDFENNLDATTLAAILAGLDSHTVNLAMPKFEFDSQFSLKNALSALGMPVAFTDQADFSGITGQSNLLISDVVHKSFVSVDESGTEAAAATGVIMDLTSAPGGEPVTMTIDRPFIFLIQDNATGSVLFTGRVMNPLE